MTATIYFQDRKVEPDDLASRAQRLAGGLYDMGLREGDVLGVLLRNSPIYCEIILAARLAGIYYCPINWHFTASEVEFILDDSGAKAVVGHADLVDAVAAALPENAAVLKVGSQDDSDYETWLARQPRYSGPTASPRGHMAYTSGTTGRPKGVVREPVPIDQADIYRERSLNLVAQCFGIEPGCRALIPAPLYHSAPSLFTQWSVLVGEAVVLQSKFDAEEALALIERHRITTLYAVPTMFVRFLRIPDETFAKYDLSSLTFIASTGAPCPPTVKRDLLARFGPVVHETYASSETGMVTVIGPDESAQRPGSVGLPVAGATVRVVDDEGYDTDPYEVGTVYVRQPAYTDFTYRNQGSARENAGLGDLVTVGDRGYLDADGYLYIAGRDTDMVISGGVNIYPAEVENAIAAQPGVLDCVVFGVPDPEFGERLHALVHPAADVTIDIERLRTDLRVTLAGYKIPKHIDFVSSLPRDPNGKLSKKRIRDAYLEQNPAISAAAATESEPVQ